MADGWTVEKDEYGWNVFRQIFKVKESDIPFKEWIGPAWIGIDENFVVSTGIGVGDWDASSETHFQLPRFNGTILALPPFMLETSGGDHSSGSWGFKSQVEVTVF